MKNDIEKMIIEVSDAVRNSITLSGEIEESVNVIIDCIKNGKKIVLFGNGGSAADAQHIAAEFIGRFQRERESIPAISLTTDSSIITSLANDYSFEVVFSRQCESLVNSGDIVIGISTSGNSKNVTKGLEVSKKNGAKTISFLGNNGGEIKDISDISIIVDSKNTARIQEIHRIVYHIICDLVEKEFNK
tara:strand:+ start:38728 stop:39294 length:567 start_codon:yes stop_codon:yes gene_type:complete